MVWDDDSECSISAVLENGVSPEDFAKDAVGAFPIN
jgi:hypothetical protein